MQIINILKLIASSERQLVKNTNNISRNINPDFKLYQTCFIFVLQISSEDEYNWRSPYQFCYGCILLISKYIIASILHDCIFTYFVLCRSFSQSIYYDDVRIFWYLFWNSLERWKNQRYFFIIIRYRLMKKNFHAHQNLVMTVLKKLKLKSTIKRMKSLQQPKMQMQNQTRLKQHQHLPIKV